MIYVCEHNAWAAQTPSTATHAMPDVAGRAAGYGIPGVVVDGNDVFAVYQAAARAVERARAGEGPTLIECQTYRWRAHTERKGQPDPRGKAEVDAWTAKDPIVRLAERLKAQGALDDAGLAALDKSVRAEIEAAARFAEGSPFPAPESALEDMYAN
jgi:pyruvate dehydrogenase E1 component alpha subunit